VGARPCGLSGSVAVELLAVGYQGQCTFSAQGSEGTFAVPAGMTSVHVVANGGAGGRIFGGLGGRGVRTPSEDLRCIPAGVQEAAVPANGTFPFNGNTGQPRAMYSAAASWQGDARSAPLSMVRLERDIGRRGGNRLVRTSSFLTFVRRQSPTETPSSVLERMERVGWQGAARKEGSRPAVRGAPASWSGRFTSSRRGGDSDGSLGRWDDWCPCLFARARTRVEPSPAVPPQGVGVVFGEADRRATIVRVIHPARDRTRQAWDLLRML
jgi:hypothetical protein